jgi:coenzyme F420 biosynthesis associated uncharacterized protein
VSALVDGELAERLAARAAGSGPAAMAGSRDLAGADERAREAVLAYTGLTPAEDVPHAEWVSRAEWAAINLASMRALLEPVEARLAGSVKSEGRAGELTAAATGRVMAAQIAALLALVSRRVLGQYEYPLRGGERPPRLLMVGQNLDSAAVELNADRDQLLEWVTLHEVTHAVHFSSAPWLRAHLGGLVDRLLVETPSQLSMAGLLGGLRRAVKTDPRKLVDELREADPVTLLAPAATRPTIAEVQATMAIIEGYAEHVMDEAGEHLGPAVPALREALDRRRRNRSTLARLLSWLLGFEMKLRQYRDGKRFADAVVAAEGIGGLNRAWEGPGELPSLAELADPDSWLARVSVSAV